MGKITYHDLITWANNTEFRFPLKLPKVNLTKADLWEISAEEFTRAIRYIAEKSAKTGLYHRKTQVIITGLYIKGDVGKPDDVVQLADLVLKVGLRLQACIFDVHISMRNAKLHSLDMSGSIIESFDGFGIQVEHESYFGNGFVSKGTFRITNARFLRRLSFSGGKFREGNRDNFRKGNCKDYVAPIGAIDACNLYVGGSLYMDRDNHTLNGQTRYHRYLQKDYNDFGFASEWLKSRRITGKKKPGSTPVNFDPNTIDEDNVLNPDSDQQHFFARGLVTLRGAKIEGRWYCNEAIIEAGFAEMRDGRETFISAYEYKEIEDSGSEKAKCVELTRSNYFRYTASIEGYYIEVKGSTHINGASILGLIRIAGGIFQGKISFKGSSLSVIPQSNLRLEAHRLARSTRLARGCLDAYSITCKASIYFGGWFPGVDPTDENTNNGDEYFLLHARSKDVIHYAEHMGWQSCPKKGAKKPEAIPETLCSVYTGFICFRGSRIEGRVVFDAGEYSRGLNWPRKNADVSNQEYHGSDNPIPEQDFLKIHQGSKPQREHLPPNHTLFSLDFSNATIDQNVMFEEHFVSGRTVRFKGAIIGGTLSIRSATFWAMDALVVANALMTEMKKLEDDIKPSGNKKEKLKENYVEKKLKNSLYTSTKDYGRKTGELQYVAGDFSSITLEQDIRIRDSSRFFGTLKLKNATVKGDVNLCDGRELSEYRSCCHLYNRRYTYAGFLKEIRMISFWAINAEHMTVEGDFDTGNSNAVKESPSAANSQTTVSRGIRPIIAGKLILHYSKIGGRLDMRGFHKEVDIPKATLDELNPMQNIIYPDGENDAVIEKDSMEFLEIHLDTCHASLLHADEYLPQGGREQAYELYRTFPFLYDKVRKIDGFKGGLKLDGFIYESLHRDMLDPESGDEEHSGKNKKKKNYQKWIETRAGRRFRPQPYRQLASVLRTKGMPGEANEVEIMMGKEFSRTLLQSDETKSHIIMAFLVAVAAFALIADSAPGIITSLCVAIIMHQIYYAHKNKSRDLSPKGNNITNYPFTKQAKHKVSSIEFIWRRSIGSFIGFGHRPMQYPLIVGLMLYFITVLGTACYVSNGYLMPSLHYNDRYASEYWQNFQSNKITLAKNHENIDLRKDSYWFEDWWYILFYDYQFSNWPYPDNKDNTIYATLEINTNIDPSSPELELYTEVAHGNPYTFNDQTLPTFNAWLYATDTLIPLIDFNETDTWHFVDVPNRKMSADANEYPICFAWLRDWIVPRPTMFFGMMTFLGWALATVAIAGLTLKFRSSHE